MGGKKKGRAKQRRLAAAVANFADLVMGNGTAESGEDPDPPVGGERDELMGSGNGFPVQGDREKSGEDDVGGEEEGEVESRAVQSTAAAAAAAAGAVRRLADPRASPNARAAIAAACAAAAALETTSLEDDVKELAAVALRRRLAAAVGTGRTFPVRQCRLTLSNPR